MRIWKKALSAGLTVMLLASLTASAAFATKGAAATDSDQTDVLDCSLALVATAVTCSQLADGISTVTLIGDDDDGVAGGYTTYISASGATIIGVGGQFVLTGGIVTAPVNADLNDATDTIILRAPATAGSATVSVFHIATSNGLATLEGTLTITFTATSGLDLSVANSSVKLVAAGNACAAAALTSTTADKATNPAAKLCVILKDGNGSAITTGATVAITITPVGLAVAALSDGTAAGAGTAQAASTAVNTVAGSYAFGIGGSNLAGVATIGISVTQGTTTTTLAPVTFTFSGSLASVAATSKVLAIPFGGGGAAVNYTGADASGNPVGFTATATSSDTTVFTIGAITAYGGVPATPGTIAVACLKVGMATVTAKSGTLASSPVTVYCSDVADTFSVAFSAATVTPGGSATVTVTILDENGLPASSSGTPTAIESSGATSDFSAPGGSGKSTATFLAPFNTGVATVLVTIASTTTGSASAQINIGAVVPAITGGTAATALGVVTSGPFSATTKVAGLGKYQTFFISFGPGAAGQTVGILVATKNAAGVWSSFTRLTGRVADSSGNVYYYFRSSTATWISVRGDVGGSLSTAVQGRWR